MIIFLYGPDDYRREEKKKFYIKEFERKYSGLSVRSFDFVEPDAPDEFTGFRRNQSIFSAKGGSASGGELKKLAVLENAYEADEKQLAQALEPLPSDKATTVLFSEKEKPNKALSFLLKKPATAEEFEYLKGSEWELFIGNQAKRHAVNLDAAALSFLLKVYQGNTWGLVTELEKVACLGKDISKVDLENLGLEVMPDFWVTMNGLKNPNIAQRLTTLERIFSRNEPPPKIFNILSSMWREKIPQMAEYDLKVKSGKLEYDEVLLDLVLS